MLFIVSALTGCPVADRHANLFASHWRAHAGLTSSPQIGGPTASGNASLSGPNVVGTGSFLRSLLIPGTRYLDPDWPLQSKLA